MTKETAVDQELEALLEYIRSSRKVDFTGYKQSSLGRRIKKRMAELGVTEYGDYVDYLEVHPDEFTALFNTILINVTSFFRDEAAWKHVKTELIPKIIGWNGEDEQIRIWSAGCSTGEESYSIAILLAEALGLDEMSRRVKIYATDLDEEALLKARKGSYTSKELESLPEEYRRKYIVPSGKEHSFKQELRRSVIFGRHDLIQDAPISRLDLLICRNTLMYLNVDTQRRILGKFNFALKNPGYLFLGNAELMLTHSKVFSQADLKNRIFMKTENIGIGEHVKNLVEPVSKLQTAKIGKILKLRESLFEEEKAAILVVDTNTNLLLANKTARTYFSIKKDALGKPIRDYDVSYNPLELRSSLNQCLKDGDVVNLAPIKFNSPSEDIYFEVVISPLYDDNEKIGASIHFNDVTRPNRLREEFEQSNQELETANEELQSAQEELETTNEELQSTNEELETTNEELQSTNEELETMNEELQSTNEELETTNEELRVLTSELNESKSFLNSIITSVDSAIIVLDSKFKVQLWNYKAKDLCGLTAEEVQGTSFFEIDCGLPVGKLKKQIKLFADSKGKHADLEIEGINRRGREISCKIRLSTIAGDDKGMILLVNEI